MYVSFLVLASSLMSVQEYGFLELYAGRAYVTYCMRSNKVKSARFDIKYARQKPGRRSNYMDFASHSGLPCLTSAGG